MAGMPRKKLAIPSFQSESAEAAWWEEHRAAVETDLRAAMRERKTISLKEIMPQSRMGVWGKGSRPLPRVTTH